MMLLNEKNDKHRFLDVVDTIKDNRCFLISLLVLIIGMLFGAVYVGRAYEMGGYFETEFIKYLEVRTSSSFINLFFKFYFNGLVFLVIMLFSSIGMPGIAFVPAVLFFKGFGTASFLGLLYRNYRLTGLAFANLVVVPPFVCFGFLMCVFAAKCLPLSLGFIKVLKTESYKPFDLRLQLIKTLRTFLFCVLFLILSALLEALLSIGFLRFFEF